MNADAEFLRGLATMMLEIADVAPRMLKTTFRTEADRLTHCADVIDRASAIPPREATEEMLRAGMRELNHNWLRSPPSDMWRAMYDAAIAEKEGK